MPAHARSALTCLCLEELLSCLKTSPHLSALRVCVQVGDGNKFSETFSFKTLQAVSPTWTPYKWVVCADLGGTYNSSVTLEHMLAAGGDVSLLIGDFTYSGMVAD